MKALLSLFSAALMGFLIGGVAGCLGAISASVLVHSGWTLIKIVTRLVGPLFLFMVGSTLVEGSFEQGMSFPQERVWAAHLGLGLVAALIVVALTPWDSPCTFASIAPEEQIAFEGSDGPIAR